jgi:hypothetical protein
MRLRVFCQILSVIASPESLVGQTQTAVSPLSSANHSVLEPTPAAFLVSTIAGAGLPATWMIGTSAVVWWTGQVAADAAGNIYFADSLLNLVFRMDLTGGITHCGNRLGRFLRGRRTGFERPIAASQRSGRGQCWKCIHQRPMELPCPAGLSRRNYHHRSWNRHLLF